MNKETALHSFLICVLLSSVLLLVGCTRQAADSASASPETDLPAQESSEPQAEDVLAAYDEAARLYDWFDLAPMSLDESDSVREGENTYAEAVTAINRMLGRDESATELLSVSNPFSDLAERHWAYMNVLEAAGELKDHLSVSEMQETSVPENTNAYYFCSTTDGWAVSKEQLFHTADGGKNWDKVGKPFAFTVSGLFFFSDQDGVLLGKSEETSCILLKTSDGGETWNDLLANPVTQADYLPVEQFPTEKSLMESIVSAELRPASRTAAYLTIRYCPYESIHVYDFEVTRQAVITAGK